MQNAKKNSDVYTFLGYIDIYLLVVKNKDGVQQQSNLKLVPNIFPQKKSPFSTRTSPPQKNPQTFFSTKKKETTAAPPSQDRCGGNGHRRGAGLFGRCQGAGGGGKGWRPPQGHGPNSRPS